MAKNVLGKGLGALITSSPAVSGVSRPPALAQPAPGDIVRRVPLAQIVPSPLQPRKEFVAAQLTELMESIREHGVIQPLIVRPVNGKLELIAGERRFRASRELGLAEVPVITREATDKEVLEMALIENLQREDLNPIEEALGYAQLIEQFQLTQETAAAKVGKSRAVVANALRLLKLTPELQAYLRHGQLSVGHAKVILGLTGAAEQKLAVERVLKDGLNVRQTEDLVARLQQSSTQAPTKAASGSKPAPPRDVHTASLETKLQERFGTKVAVRYRKGKGAVEIRFFNDDDLERILQIAGVKVD